MDSTDLTDPVVVKQYRAEVSMVNIIAADRKGDKAISFIFPPTWTDDQKADFYARLQETMKKAKKPRHSEQEKGKVAWKSFFRK